MKLADRIILHLMKYGRKDPTDIMIPNFYHGMYEMDVFKLIKKTEYVVEYEVKVSRSDYFNDFNKFRTEYGQYHTGTQSWPEKRDIYKHEQIEKGEGPNRFFFIVPENLIQPAEVPEHAGLMYFYESTDEVRYGRDRIATIKPAPLIHKKTFSDYKSLATSLSWREENLRRRLHAAKDVQTLKQKSI